jgi:predicted ABC-type ATPase
LNRPGLTIIAGANGSGKTTLTRWNSDIFRAIPVLDPDMIAKTLQSTMPAAFPIAAARQVLTSAREHINKREGFAVETTLAGKHYLKMMVEARIRGFEIVLVYIGTGNVEINLARIRNRVLAGGHNVPEEDVRRRYKRSFENLPTAIQRADHTILFDNSSEEGYRLVALLGPSGNQWFEPIPEWAVLETGQSVPE